jgi:hypothetical protein
MLRTTILSFVIFYFVDSLALCVAVETGVFLVEYLLCHTVWWHFVAQLPIGVALALLGRWRQQRLRDYMLVVRYSRLREGFSLIWQCTVVSLLVLVMLPYNVRLTKPVEVLQKPFAQGIFLSAGGALIVLLIIESLGYVLHRHECTFRLPSMYPLCGITIVCVATLDLLAFSNGHYLALVFMGLVALFVLGGKLSEWILLPPMRETPERKRRMY